MNIRSLTRGDGAVIGAAVLLLIASFLPFFSIDHPDKSVSSWSPALFPLLPVVTLGALASAAVANVRFWRTGRPSARKMVGLRTQHLIEPPP